MKITSLLALIITLITLPGMAQDYDPKPYYDLVGNLSVHGEVTQPVLAEWNPYTFELVVPKGAAHTTGGFDIGFGVLPSVNEQPVELDSVRITTCPGGLPRAG